MPPNTTWFELPKFQTKFNNEKREWKELKSKCLMKTETLSDLEKSEKYTPIDPNVLMNMRHKMAKPHFCKSFPISREQIKTHSTKPLKEENHKKLLKNNEEKSVRREINKLQQILQNYRFIGKTENKVKPKSVNASKFEKPKIKFRKKFESFEEIREVDAWFTESLQMTMETKMNEHGTPFDVKVYLKRKKKNENNYEDFLDRISCQKGSVLGVVSPQDKYRSWVCETEAGKKEIMNRFFRSGVLETEFKLHHQRNLLKDEKTEKSNQNEFEVKKITDKKENLIKIHIDKANKRRLIHAWKVWRVYTLTCQKRQKERMLYEDKVDKFLVKLQEQTIQDLQPQKKINKCSNLVRKSSFRSNSQNILAKEVLKKKKDKDEKLQTIAKSIKESQKEAHERLVAIEDKTDKAKVLKVLTNIFETVKDRRKAFSNPNFLVRMEKRRDERNARRRKIEERKRIREEEKEKVRIEMEEEEKKMRKQEKRREFEKLTEKRRREKERKEQEKKVREKFKALSSNASDHYKKVLLRRYGLIPWLKFMQIMEERVDTATTFAEKILTRKAFCTWAANVRSTILQKKEKANDFYGRTLLKKWFRVWKVFSRERIRQLQVAVDWQELRLTDWAFCKWLDFIQEEHLNNLSKQGFADLHFERKLKQKYLKNLKNYPEQKKLQLASENRRRMLRQKVLEILPDYKPMNICTNS